MFKDQKKIFLRISQLEDRLIKSNQLKKKDKSINKRSVTKEEKGHFIITLHRSTNQEGKTNINILTSTNRSTKYMKQNQNLSKIQTVNTNNWTSEYTSQ